MSKKVILSALGAAYIASSSPIFAEVEVVSLEELRNLCTQQENHEQIKPGKVNFQCTKNVQFWVHAGSSPVRLPNSGGMCVQAYIKGQSHSTDSWSLPFKTESQMGQCENYKQYQATTTYTEPGSCDLLNKIANLGAEAEYCEVRMNEEGLTASLEDSIKQIQSNPESIGEIASGTHPAMFTATGMEKNCEHFCPAPSEPKKGDSSSSSDGSDSSTSSSTSSSAAGNRGDTNDSDSYDLDKNTELYRKLGARVEPVKIRKNFLRGNYGMLVLEETPQNESELYKLGLQVGDHLYKINGTHVETVEDLVKALNSAKEKQKAVVKYIRNDEKEITTIANYS